MSYLKDVEYSLKNIDELCDDALKRDKDYDFYVEEIQATVRSAIIDFQSLTYELKLSKEKLTEATRIIDGYINEMY